MWRKCPTEQDEPLYLSYGMQISDALCGMGVFFVCVLFLKAEWLLGMAAPFYGLGGMIATIYALIVLKKGKPPGQHWHWLHRMELIRIPGACSPKEQQYHIW